MSKTLEAFRQQMVDSGWWKKLFKVQTPGARIGPAKNRQSEYRLDAGEVHDGKKKVNLQVNSEAKSDPAVSYRKKNGTHANLASGIIDVNTPEDKQMEAFDVFWGDVAEQAKDGLS
ncbi:MAG: hypothetical protein LQ346_004381 [Caloplaca aetnensis]|nr:MAG: hypothetical protein LQ346_004381 [Caloplaca aetnensis]